MSQAQTVTVLFTDLVASTELLSAVGARRMHDLLAEHHALLHDVVRSANGTKVKTIGDGFMAAFAGAGSAVQAAAAMQRALQSHNRGADVSLQMRVGVASGDAHTSDGDWFGPPVVQAARLCATASTGEVLMTEATALVGGAAGADAERIGAFNLKGLADPVVVWRVGWQREPSAPRVVIADDAALVREGIVRLLERAGFEVMAQAGDADELLEHVAARRPDVVITDVRMPPDFAFEGIVAAERIADRYPGVGIIVLTQSFEPTHLARLLACASGGLAYLLKEDVVDVSAFLDTARRVAAGERLVEATA